MSCRVIHCWTFSGLVGAFLDLVIAYFLLCSSFVVFFASKFLGVFGLSLPCPCDGQFVNPNSSYCLHRLLVEFPVEKVSNVELAVRNKFPFDSVRDRNLDLSLKLVEDRNVYGNGFNELEGEASCSLLSDSKRSENVVGGELVPVNLNGGEFGAGRKVDMKGKGIMNHRKKLGIRRRRRSGFDHGKFSSVSYYDRLGVPQSPSSINEEQNEMIKGRSAPVDFGLEDKYFLAAEEDPTVMILGDRNFRDVAMNEYIDEYEPMKKNDELRTDAQDNADSDQMNIRGLEQALEEEHIGRAALYLELEKERNAAATAADEALAMILRLQEEKASIEMQARQYQRIIEEKFAYDAEEMNILKEILLRREMEKHFLEKEVEAYRQMGIPGNEQLDGNLPDMMDNQNRDPSSFDLTEDTNLMLHELCESIEKKDIVKPRKFVSPSNDIQKCSFVPLTVQECDEDGDFSKQVDQESHLSSNCTDDDCQELQEKMLIVNNSQLSHPNKGQKLEAHFHSYMTSNSLQHNFLEKTIPITGEEQGTTNSENICQNAIENGKTRDVSRIYIQNDDKDNRHGEDVTLDSKDTSNMMFDKESHVYDVHVIDAKSNFHNEVRENESELVLETDTSKVNNNGEMAHESCGIQIIENKRNSLSTSRSQIVTDIHKSNSDMAMGLPPFGSRGRSLLSDMRRSSMSTLDTERIKIDTEIKWLREKLRTVQEGRDKLNFSVDQEKETLQLKLLEDIASQLREIRQLTEPGKTMRQASLPPLSSKAMLKRRRCQSAYLNNSS